MKLLRTPLAPAVIAALFLLPISLLSQTKPAAQDDIASFSPDPWVDLKYTPEQLSKLVPSARPEDVSSPEAAVRALHDSVSGLKGSWNPDRFRSLFLPNVLFSYVQVKPDGSQSVSTLSLDKLVQVLTELHRRSDWYEKVFSVHVTMIDRPTEKVQLANVDYLTGESDKQSALPTVTHTRSSTSLVFLNNRWWIASHIW